MEESTSTNLIVASGNLPISTAKIIVMTLDLQWAAEETLSIQRQLSET
jgi:hypothetical protein